MPVFCPITCIFCGVLSAINPIRVDFVLSYARRGELLDYIHRLSSFDEGCTRWYTAEIIVALEYLHSKGIIHRSVGVTPITEPSSACSVSVLIKEKLKEH